MEDFSITALVPVLNRPANLPTLINSFLGTVPVGRADMLFITGEDCVEEIEAIKTYSGPIRIEIVPKEILSWAKRINFGITKSIAPWLLCAADDLRFHKGWFEAAERESKDFVGILGTNDLGNPRTMYGIHSTHPIVSRKYVDEQGTIDGELGKLCNASYRHNYTDDEMILTAKKRNVYKHVFDCFIEHLHPAWGKSKMDDVYQAGTNQITWEHDSKLFESRKHLFT